QTPHDTIAPLAHDDVEPAIAGAVVVVFADPFEARHAVIQLYAFGQALEHGGIDRAMHTHGVFALQRVLRVFQPPFEFTVRGHQQQAGGVDVETTYGDPATT